MKWSSNSTQGREGTMNTVSVNLTLKLGPNGFKFLDDKVVEAVLLLCHVSLCYWKPSCALIPWRPPNCNVLSPKKC